MMAKAYIVFEDGPKNNVLTRIMFDPRPADEKSMTVAQRAAAVCRTEFLKKYGGKVSDENEL